MDYRNGKCSQCGAEYKIPASFPHDVARCKVCEGVVQVEPAAGRAAPAKSEAPAAAPKPQAPAAPPALVEVRPEDAEKKRKERGTLARLKAERAAAARTSTAKPAARPAVAKPAGAAPVAQEEDGPSAAARAPRAASPRRARARS